MTTWVAEHPRLFIALIIYYDWGYVQLIRAIIELVFCGLANHAV